MEEHDLTEQDPVRLKSGKFGCPDCSTPLDDGLVPYSLNGNFLGSFEGLICKMCGYGLLSEQGYEDSGKMAKARGQFTKILDVDLNGKLYWSDNVQITSNVYTEMPKYGENEFKSTSTTYMENLIPSPIRELNV